MRSIRLAVLAFRGARLYGAELELAVVICGNSRKADRLAPLCEIARTRILALFIRAPDFQNCVGHSLAFAIQNAAADGNHLGVGSSTSGNQMVHRPPAQADREERSYRLRSGRDIWPSVAHRVSMGVASRPRSTISNRYTSANSGEVFSQSKEEISRCF